MSTTPLIEVFAERLRQALKLRQMTQADLAEATGLMPAAVSHFSRGRRAPSLQNLLLLADALDVSADFLLGRSHAQAVREPGGQRVEAALALLSATQIEVVVAMLEGLAAKGQVAKDTAATPTRRSHQ